MAMRKFPREEASQANVSKTKGSLTQVAGRKMLNDGLQTKVHE